MHYMHKLKIMMVHLFTQHIYLIFLVLSQMVEMHGICINSDVGRLGLGDKLLAL